MVDVNRTPFNTIPKDWAFDVEKGPFMRDILDQLHQLRSRTGGDGDEITDLAEMLSTSRVYRDRQDELSALKAEIQTGYKNGAIALKMELDATRAEIQTARLELRTLKSQLNAFIAEVQSA